MKYKCIHCNFDYYYKDMIWLQEDQGLCHSCYNIVVGEIDWKIMYNKANVSEIDSYMAMVESFIDYLKFKKLSWKENNNG